jgi:hypothetical protein
MNERTHIKRSIYQKLNLLFCIGSVKIILQVASTNHTVLLCRTRKETDLDLLAQGVVKTGITAIVACIMNRSNRRKLRPKISPFMLPTWSFRSIIFSTHIFINVDQPSALYFVYFTSPTNQFDSSRQLTKNYAPSLKE